MENFKNILIKFKSLNLLFVLLSTSLFSVEDCASTAITGIIVTRDGTDLSQINRDKGVHILFQNDEIKGASSTLESYIGDDLNDINIQKIKDSLLSYLSDHHIFAMVTLPPQDSTDGILIVQLLFSCVSEVCYIGQKWFPTYLFESRIPIESGEEVNQEKMLNDISFMNRNPFRRTEMIYSPGKEKGTTDVEILTKDRLPLRVWFRADSTGLKPSDTIRLIAGGTWGNMFNVGDVLTYQYSTSPDFHQFQSHLLMYTSYLPWQDILYIYGTYGTSHPDIRNFKSDGEYGQASCRYQIPFKPYYTTFTHKVELGSDFKYLNSNLFFSGVETASSARQESVYITQIIANYSLRAIWENHQLTSKFEIVASPAKGLFPNQEDSKYSSLRPGAKARYAYFKGSFGYRYLLPWDFSLSLLLRGQGATDPLLSSEQFALGGIDTVRGYVQTAFLADNAFVSNLAFYFPTFTLFRRFEDKSTFYLFYDVAYGSNYQPISDAVSDQYMSGVGGGYIFEVLPYLSCKTDYGFKLNEIDGDIFFGRFYFSVTASY